MNYILVDSRKIDVEMSQQHSLPQFNVYLQVDFLSVFMQDLCILLIYFL